jgi:hypothetical protein
MNDDWEQWPPIEGNDTDPLPGIALFAVAVFAIGMIVYVFI